MSRTRRATIDSTTDPIHRTIDHAKQMFPKAEIRTKSFRGKPLVLAIKDGNEGADVIQLLRLWDLDAERAARPELGLAFCDKPNRDNEDVGGEITTTERAGCGKPPWTPSGMR